MGIKKTRVQFTIFDDFDQHEAVLEALKDDPGYEELTVEEIIRKVNEEQDQLNEEDLRTMKNTLDEARFVEVDDGIVLISSMMISITVESGADKLQDLVREVLDDEDIQYEEEANYSLEVESAEQVLEAPVEDIVGEYDLEIVISGEDGVFAASEDNGVAMAHGDKSILEDLKEVL